MYEPATLELKKKIQDDISLAQKTLSGIEDEFRKIGMTSGKKVLPAFLFSNFISEEQYEEIKHYSESFAGILNKIALHYCKKNNLENIFLQKEYGFNKSGCSIFNIINRLDMFYDGKNIKLIEFNSESPSGIGRIVLIDKIFLNTPQLKKFRNRIIKHTDIMQELLETFLKTYKKSGGKKDKPSIALVDWKDVSTLADQEFIIEYFSTKGYNAFSCDPCNLKYADGKLYYEGTEIDIVFKRVIARELISKKETCGDFLRALKDDKVCIINPNMSIILNDKRILHYLSNGTFDVILDDQEIKIIKEIIPWSREVKDRKVTDLMGTKVDMIDFVLKQKENLVLKPGKGYGGRHVVIGCQVSEKKWNITLKTALAEQDWIAQEYIDIPTIEVFEKSGFVNKYINLSPFIIDGKLSGFFTRISESQIININKGGGIIPTFVIKK